MITNSWSRIVPRTEEECHILFSQLKSVPMYCSKVLILWKPDLCHNLERGDLNQCEGSGAEATFISWKVTRNFQKEKLEEPLTLTFQRIEEERYKRK